MTKILIFKIFRAFYDFMTVWEPWFYISTFYTVEMDKLYQINLQKQPPEVLCKKGVILEIWQNSQENACAKVSFLIKLQALDLQLY